MKYVYSGRFTKLFTYSLNTLDSPSARDVLSDRNALDALNSLNTLPSDQLSPSFIPQKGKILEATSFKTSPSSDADLFTGHRISFSHSLFISLLLLLADPCGDCTVTTLTVKMHFLNPHMVRAARTLSIERQPYLSHKFSRKASIPFCSFVPFV